MKRWINSQSSLQIIYRRDNKQTAVPKAGRFFLDMAATTVPGFHYKAQDSTIKRTKTIEFGRVFL